MYAVSEKLLFGSKDDVGCVGKRTMISCPIRLVTFPVGLALRVLLWCGMYILQYSRMLCRFIAGWYDFYVSSYRFCNRIRRWRTTDQDTRCQLCIFPIPQLEEIIVSNIAKAHIALSNLK